jgi:hypothetical protein
MLNIGTAAASISATTADVILAHPRKVDAAGVFFLLLHSYLGTNLHGVLRRLAL